MNGSWGLVLSERLLNQQPGQNRHSMEKGYYKKRYMKQLNWLSQQWADAMEVKWKQTIQVLQVPTDNAEICGVIWKERKLRQGNQSGQRSLTMNDSCHKILRLDVLQAMKMVRQTRHCIIRNCISQSPGTILLTGNWRLTAFTWWELSGVELALIS